MKTARITSISIISSAIILAGCSMGELMVHETKSPYDFEKTVSVITEEARHQGWVVPKVHDFQQSLLKFDQDDPGRIKVVKVCKPEYAARLLRHDESKYVSVLMPCSLSVYEKSDGHTYVAAMNMELMSLLFQGDIGDTLSAVAKEDKNILSFMKP
ncbi:MAG: DUF302 domain-containing protein [Chromatiales bacterium]|jgi:uncharacterized protein (DUF302 family)